MDPYSHAKTHIVELLGEKALVLPALLNNALVANERVKYVLSLLQMAVGQAENPQSTAPTLRTERKACGITDASFDHTVGESESDGHGAYHIPEAQRLVAVLLVPADLADSRRRQRPRILLRLPMSEEKTGGKAIREKVHLHAPMPVICSMSA